MSARPNPNTGPSSQMYDPQNEQSWHRAKEREKKKRNYYNHNTSHINSHFYCLSFFFLVVFAFFTFYFLAFLFFLACSINLLFSKKFHQIFPRVHLPENQPFYHQQ